MISTKQQQQEIEKGKIKEEMAGLKEEKISTIDEQYVKTNSMEKQLAQMWHKTQFVHVTHLLFKEISSEKVSA